METIYIVTYWSVNSSGYSEGSNVEFHTDYDKAVKSYGDRWDSNTCPCGQSKIKREEIRDEERIENHCDCDQNYISVTRVDVKSGLKEFQDFQDGSWKRPSGKQLRVVHMENGLGEVSLQTYPWSRTY
jgi:ferredoxin-thioredoxin reductase catalytic subunit